MPLRNAYALWNNKGGVGKSTITFHLATRYAEKNPARKVLVIDLCPQANASMMVLGGGTFGEERVLAFCQRDPVPQTVVGYLATVLSGGPGAALPDWKDFVVQPNKLNQNVPQNLYLLCGDGNLEPMAPLISDWAAQAALTPASNPWKWVHQAIRQFIDDVALKDETEWLVLVDTNPSFSIYTEIAISSVDCLIVPVNADDASRVATNAMFTLIWGADPPHPIYGQYTYAKRAEAAKIQRPIVHLIVGNRLTQYEGPAAAFEAMSDATANTLFDAYKKNPERFTEPEKAPKDVKAFRKLFSVPLRDFNTAGVVAAHTGTPVSKLQDRYYPVYGAEVRVSSARIEDCREAIDDVIDRI